jgi:hypothetical protein
MKLRWPTFNEVGWKDFIDVGATATPRRGYTGHATARRGLVLASRRCATMGCQRTCSSSGTNPSAGVTAGSVCAFRPKLRGAGDIPPARASLCDDAAERWSTDLEGQDVTGEKVVDTTLGYAQLYNGAVSADYSRPWP